MGLFDKYSLWLLHENVQVPRMCRRQQSQQVKVADGGYRAGFLTGRVGTGHNNQLKYIHQAQKVHVLPWKARKLSVITLLYRTCTDT